MKPNSNTKKLRSPKLGKNKAKYKRHFFLITLTDKLLCKAEVITMEFIAYEKEKYTTA